jgi:hypothetical protein
MRLDLFIPLAEESGLIKPIADQVVDAIIPDLRANLANDRSLHIAINLCADHIATGRALEVIQSKLENTGIDPPQPAGERSGRMQNEATGRWREMEDILGGIDEHTGRSQALQSFGMCLAALHLAPDPQWGGRPFPASPLDSQGELGQYGKRAHGLRSRLTKTCFAMDRGKKGLCGVGCFGGPSNGKRCAFKPYGMARISPAEERAPISRLRQVVRSSRMNGGSLSTLWW